MMERMTTPPASIGIDAGRAATTTCRRCLNSITRGTPVRHQLDTAIRMKHALTDSRTI
jgi:hypothetical protein